MLLWRGEGAAGGVGRGGGGLPGAFLSGLLHLQLYLQLPLCGPATRTTASAAAVPTTNPSLLRRLCSSNICRNGECYVIGEQTRCICAQLFLGTHCENVDMAHIQYAIIGSVVIFQWPHPPRLRGYSFIYYRLDRPDAILYKNKILMSDDEHSVLVGNLHQGTASYRVCIEDEYIADRVISTNSVHELSNCITLQTGPDYHTLAAWCLTFGLCFVAACIIYTQRNKIELLYFGGKPMAIYERSVENGDVINTDK